MEERGIDLVGSGGDGGFQAVVVFDVDVMVIAMEEILEVPATSLASARGSRMLPTFPLHLGIRWERRERI